MNTKEKKEVAKEALFFIKDNQTIGIGAGSTTEIFLKLLAKKIKKQKLNIRVMPCCERTKNLCKKLNLKIRKARNIDLAIDGADKIDENLNISKGLSRLEFINEKKIDYKAKKCIIIADSSKFVKNILDYDILVASEKKPKANFIKKVKKLRGKIYKIRVKANLEPKELEEILRKKFKESGIFTKFRQLIVIGVKDKKKFIRPREKFLQVAVDIAYEEKALKLIKKISAYADIIEIGTPLVKLEGMRLMGKILGKRYRNNLIMADIKTADTGSYETGLAIKQGADIVSVLAGSSNRTILNSIKTAKKYEKKILVDLIDIKNKNRMKRLREILNLKLKPDIICIHTAIDVQHKEKFFNLSRLVKICRKNEVLVAIAGGINKKKILELKKYSPDIFVIGSAITKSKNPKKKIKELSMLIKK
jgi:ribose 5-phosphate isomerase